MREILITGGAGFIGSTLADKLLQENNKVIVVDNFNDYYDVRIKEQNIEKNINNPNYKLYREDICSKEALRKIFAENNIDTVVHLAARAGVRDSIKKPFDYIHTNLYGTINLLEGMKDFGVKKIVFASSSSVYGSCPLDEYVENFAANEPISPYAATKLSCEQFIYTYSMLYGIRAVCLRFFTVYGPRQRPDLVIYKFTELMKNEKPIPVYGDGTTLRDYTYIDDIISGICAAIDYNKTSYEIINLGSGKAYPLNEIIKYIENALNKQAKINYLPMQKGDMTKTISSISKAQKLLNYKPQTSIEDGIREFIKWFVKK